LTAVAYSQFFYDSIRSRSFYICEGGTINKRKRKYQEKEKGNQAGSLAVDTQVCPQKESTKHSRENTKRLHYNKERKKPALQNPDIVERTKKRGACTFVITQACK
jgi:hypothetical protein